MRGNAMSTHRDDIDDVIPDFDFRGAIPNPFLGLIGANYLIRSRGNGSIEESHAVISVERRGREWIEFVDLEIAPCRVAGFETEWVARQAIASFRGVDPASFDLTIEVRRTG